MLRIKYVMVLIVSVGFSPFTLHGMFGMGRLLTSQPNANPAVGGSSIQRLNQGIQDYFAPRLEELKQEEGIVAKIEIPDYTMQQRGQINNEDKNNNSNDCFAERLTKLTREMKNLAYGAKVRKNKFNENNSSAQLDDASSFD